MKANDFETAVKVIKDRLPYYLMLIDNGQPADTRFQTEKGVTEDKLSGFVAWLESDAARWNTSACACEKCVCGAKPPAEFSHDEHWKGKMTWVGHEGIDLS